MSEKRLRDEMVWEALAKALVIFLGAFREWALCPGGEAVFASCRAGDWGDDGDCPGDLALHRFSHNPVCVLV